MNTGWICPKCQRVYAPSVTECVACNAPFQVQNWPFSQPPSVEPQTPIPYLTTSSVMIGDALPGFYNIGGMPIVDDNAAEQNL